MWVVMSAETGWTYTIFLHAVLDLVMYCHPQKYVFPWERISYNEGAPADTLFTRTNGGVYILQVVQVFVSKILPKRTALLLYNGHTYIPYQLRDHQLLDMCLPSYIKSSFTDSFWDSFSSHMTSCPGSWLEQQSRIQRSTFGKHC